MVMKTCRNRTRYVSTNIHFFKCLTHNDIEYLHSPGFWFSGILFWRVAEISHASKASQECGSKEGIPIFALLLLPPTLRQCYFLDLLLRRERNISLLYVHNHYHRVKKKVKKESYYPLLKEFLNIRYFNSELNLAG